MAKESESGVWIPKESERDNGTDFKYESLAYSGCKSCGGYGEFHVPYDDWGPNVYIIHRCDCTRPPQSQAPRPLTPEQEVKRLNTLAADAIKSLTDEIGTGDDPVAFVCAAYVESRREIAKLRHEIEQLNDGSCRFHCRVRSAMWKAGGLFVFENWHKCARPAPCHLEEMYNDWRTQHDKKI